MPRQDLALQLQEAALAPLEDYFEAIARLPPGSKDKKNAYEHAGQLKDMLDNLAHAVYGAIKAAYAADIITFRPLARELLSTTALVDGHPTLYAPQLLYPLQRMLDVVHRCTKRELFRFHIAYTVRVWQPNEMYQYTAAYAAAGRKGGQEGLRFTQRNRPYTAIPDPWCPLLSHLCFTQVLTPFEELQQQNIHLRHLIVSDTDGNTRYCDTNKLPNFWGS